MINITLQARLVNSSAKGQSSRYKDTTQTQKQHEVAHAKADACRVVRKYLNMSQLNSSRCP